MKTPYFPKFSWIYDEFMSVRSNSLSPQSETSLYTKLKNLEKCACVLLVTITSITYQIEELKEVCCVLLSYYLPTSAVWQG